MAALIAVPHAVQDDGRLLEYWIRDVKHSDDIERGGLDCRPGPSVSSRCVITTLAAAASVSGHWADR